MVELNNKIKFLQFENKKLKKTIFYQEKIKI
jgi:hypothetical protein